MEIWKRQRSKVGFVCLFIILFVSIFLKTIYLFIHLEGWKLPGWGADMEGLETEWDWVA